VDRATLEFLLGVSRRRAQQIMAPCLLERRAGVNGLADRDALITRLERIAEGDEGAWEIERRRKVANLIETLRQQWITQPQLLVEAPAAVVNQEFEDLPDGVRLEPGRITVEFDEPQQGLENSWPSPWPSATTSICSNAASRVMAKGPSVPLLTAWGVTSTRTSLKLEFDCSQQFLQLLGAVLKALENDTDEVIASD